MPLSVKFTLQGCLAAPSIGVFQLMWQRTSVHAKGEEVFLLCGALSPPEELFKANSLHRTKVIKTIEAQLETFDLSLPKKGVVLFLPPFPSFSFH